MQIKQSEVYDKVLVTEFCVFLTRRGTVTDILFFRAVKVAPYSFNRIYT